MSNGLLSWSTDSVPRNRVAEAWRSKMSDLHLAWDLSFPEHERFDAAVRYRRLDELTVADFSGSRYSGQRSDRDGPPAERVIGVLMNLSGRLVCRYAGDEVMVGPDDLLIWDSELAQGFDAVEPRRELSVMLPCERVPERLVAAAARSSSAVAAGAGSGLIAIAADQLRAITRELDQLTDAGLAIAFQSFFDTLDLALSTPKEREREIPVARTSLLLKIRHYIENNLDDPTMSARSIAAAHGVSVRTLHLVFADTGTSVSRWVRDRRLKVCYRELAQAGADTTVTDVAFRWGFNEMAHFSRVFKQSFGVTPSSVLARTRQVAGVD